MLFGIHQLNLNADHTILLLLIRIILFLHTAVGCSFHLVSQLKIHTISQYSCVDYEEANYEQV